MKIAIVTIGDTRDIKRGSGTPYYLWQELLRQGHTVHLVGPLNVKIPLLTRIFKWMSSRLGKRYLSYRDPFMGRALGQAAGRILNGLDVDLVLTNDYCLAGYLPRKKPLVLYTDDFFPRKYTENTNSLLANLAWISVYFCQHTTAQGLQHASYCFFASHFAVEEAHKYPQAVGKILTVVPYGANQPDPGRGVPRRLGDKLELLFVGKDWDRKGGAQAVEITRLLNLRGTRAHLHVAGVNLSEKYPDSFITFYGLLNKDDPIDREQLETLFSTCHVLLVPSKAEGYGLVFVEAASYGIPSLAYATSGVKTAVRHGISGVLFEPNEDISAFVHQLEDWLGDPGSYSNLAKTARIYYEKTANWQVAVSRLTTEIQSHLFSQ